jgi:hypothetical protein
MGTKASRKPPSRYAGRSALTGLLVLKPTSKGASVTLEQVRAVVRRINERKQIAEHE